MSVPLTEDMLDLELEENMHGTRCAGQETVQKLFRKYLYLPDSEPDISMSLEMVVQLCLIHLM